MPESVTDRPTKAHEYVFLLSKGPRYFYDADSIREDGPTYIRKAGGYEDAGSGIGEGTGGQDGRRALGFKARDVETTGRNKRSVWTVATQPYPGAHFATFPAKLIEPCILAGSAPRACGVCGAPWRRVVERTPMVVEPSDRVQTRDPQEARTATSGTMLEPPTSRTVGWEPSCEHHDDTGSSVVLDPFAGAGTTGMVALRHDRSFIGVELNPGYATLARERIIEDSPLLNTHAEAA